MIAGLAVPIEYKRKKQTISFGEDSVSRIQVLSDKYTINRLACHAKTSCNTRNKCTNINIVIVLLYIQYKQFQ